MNSTPSRARPERAKRRKGPSPRPAFTLVEMLVSVALMVLIMSLFAEIFQITAGSITRQKGIAENDQRARTLTTIIKADLNRRTFRDVIPYDPGQNTANQTREYFPEMRRGYFYISENDPNNDTDDVLQFTFQVNDPAIPPKYREEPLIEGHTVSLTEPDPIDVAGNRNQPEFDDGIRSVNNVGTSTAAEVAYFLRPNGNLYRRVLLIRQPYDDELTAPEPEQPNQIGAGYIYGPESFWRDFDYSAFYRIEFDSVNSVFNRIGPLRFHGTINSLSNQWNPVTSTHDPAGLKSLGIPHYRFGHNVTNGLPREVVGTNFIGRFTIQETAHPDFGYPGRIPGPGDPVPGDPMDAATPLTIDPATGLVSELQNRLERRGEDILLSNVYAFDVKVWDDGLADDQGRRFVDLGHTIQQTDGTPTGYYHISQRSPATIAGYPVAYDTWHPALPQPAPFRPIIRSGELGNAEEEIPLSAIQIRIQFFDPSSKQMRQLTLVQSLVD